MKELKALEQACLVIVQFRILGYWTCLLFEAKVSHTLYEKFQVPISVQVKELINFHILHNLYENNIDNLLPKLQIDNHEGCMPLSLGT